MEGEGRGKRYKKGNWELGEVNKWGHEGEKERKKGKRDKVRKERKRSKLKEGERGGGKQEGARKQVVRVSRAYYYERKGKGRGRTKGLW